LLPRRDSICDELEKHGTFVLREGEVEDYVGLSHSSKGKYLEAANEVTLGKRSLAHQDALRAFYTRLMESLAQMTASTTRGARRFPVWP
jgi:hypothetical protein